MKLNLNQQKWYDEGKFWKTNLKRRHANLTFTKLFDMIVLSFGKSGNINVKLVLQHCCVLQPLFKPVNNQICCKSGLLWLVKRATYLLDSFCSNVARQVAGFCCPFRGGSRIFFRRGCTLLLLYFSTNEPHSFFFLQNTSCIRKPQVISGGCAPPAPSP